jgi:hypothetical protein
MYFLFFQRFDYLGLLLIISAVFFDNIKPIIFLLLSGLDGVFWLKPIIFLLLSGLDGVF